ncbi:MAG: OmpA family protein [Paludibacteraceae bacterium]|nr:OmpA family protein [Paludibacteraceae bacterium]MBN2787541.1 OmpA family protein [Paludibacteraceae bacterium]
MKKLLIPFLLFFLLVGSANAQKVRWSYKVLGAVGVGKPVTLEEGFNKNCAAVPQESVEGKEPKKKDKSPAMIKFHFMPFEAQQVVVCENYNAGAIVKIDIEALSGDMRTPYIKTVYQGEASPIKGYRVSNYNFPLTKNVVAVNVYLDYKKIPGVNQIAAVGLTDFVENYTPHINLSRDNTFEEEGVVYMNEDVGGSYDPSTPIISVDRKYIYFSHQDNENNNQVYRGTLGADGKIAKVEHSPFNIPLKKSSSSVLSSISQDNNVAFVNDMTMGQPIVYKTYIKRTKKGKTEWIREKLEIYDFFSESPYLFDCMSYDSKYYFVNMQQPEGEKIHYGNDLYVGFRDEKGAYGKFVHMGYDINTVGDEIPCFLAADNKTFVFASSGHMGYGEKDLYITKRLDDTWKNWSQPINLGKVINTEAPESYFTIDSKGEFAYFVREKGEKSDLYRVEFYKPRKQEVKEEVVVQKEEIKPDPIIIIHGKVLDKKTGETLQAEIIYTDILTGEVMGRATSNGETGEYTVALPAGKFYGYTAKADGYFAVSENIDAREITETTVIEKDLYLVPIEVGQTFRLNNIFFDTAKATLRPESNEELNKLLKIMNDNPNMVIAIAGHTDWVGTDEYNMKLSDDRANAVMNYLLTNGVATARITAKGYGETVPLADNNTPEGRQTNRRVEFTIVK